MDGGSEILADGTGRGVAAHPNAVVIRRLYAALEAGDHRAAAACYAEDARFEDIAFRLQGRSEIALMWQMVCGKLIRADIGEAAADATVGVGTWTASYPAIVGSGIVVNPTTSLFRFDAELIVEHRDICDPAAWARQAFPFPISLMGRVAVLRRLLARLKLRRHRRSTREALRD